MNPIFGTIIQELEGPLVARVAQRLGIDPATAQRAVAVAIPVLLSVMAHRGAEGTTPASDTPGSIAQLLGPNTSAIAQGISQSAGVSSSQAEQLISMVGSALAEKLQQQKASAGEVVPEHAKEMAPALAAGDHESIVSAIARFGQKVLQSAPPGGRLF